MATVLRPEDMESRITDTAVTAEGHVMSIVTATGHVDLCAVNGIAYAVAYSSTEEYINSAWTAQASVPVALIRAPGTIVRLQLLATNQAITRGDPIKTSTLGHVDLGTWSVPPTIAELRAFCGKALESKALNTGGTILVLWKPTWF